MSAFSSLLHFGRFTSKAKHSKIFCSCHAKHDNYRIFRCSGHIDTLWHWNLTSSFLCKSLVIYFSRMPVVLNTSMDGWKSGSIVIHYCTCRMLSDWCCRSSCAVHICWNSLLPTRLSLLPHRFWKPHPNMKFSHLSGICILLFSLAQASPTTHSETSHELNQHDTTSLAIHTERFGISTTCPTCNRHCTKKVLLVALCGCYAVFVDKIVVPSKSFVLVICNIHYGFNNVFPPECAKYKPRDRLLMSKFRKFVTQVRNNCPVVEAGIPLPL